MADRSVFELPSESLAQHIAIVGRTGSGKTYTAKGLVERLLDAQRRVCILDPTGAWYGLRSSHDGKSAGFPVAVFGGAHGDVPIAEKSGGVLASILAGKNLPAIVDLSEMLIGQRHRFVMDFCEALYRDNRAPLHLVIDEADEFCPQNPMPETKRMLHHVDRIVRRGRIRGFRVMLITQRPAVLHKNVLTQANTLIAMRLTAPQDRKAILAWVEGQADTAKAKEVLDSLARLKRGEGWVWAPEQDILRRVEFPRILTFDSSRAPDEGDVLVEPAKLADIDLGEIKAAFEEVEQEARTLEELKAENARLTRDLAAAQKRASHAGVPEAEVQRRIREALAQHKPTVASDSGLEKKAFDKIAEIVCNTMHLSGRAAKSSGSPAVRAPTPPKRQPKGRDSLPARLSEYAPSDVTAPQQKILDVLAQLEAYGIETADKAMVAAHAGVSPTSGGYFNNLGRLRTAELIEYPAPGKVAMTVLGRARATPPSEPPSLADLHESWYRILPAPQVAILRAVVEAYPRAIAKDDLADQVGVSRTSGGYFNNLGRLRTLGAIDYPSRGQVAAAAILFPEMRDGR